MPSSMLNFEFNFRIMVHSPPLPGSIESLLEVNMNKVMIKILTVLKILLLLGSDCCLFKFAFAGPKADLLFREQFLHQYNAIWDYLKK